MYLAQLLVVADTLCVGAAKRSLILVPLTNYRARTVVDEKQPSTFYNLNPLHSPQIVGNIDLYTRPILEAASYLVW